MEDLHQKVITVLGRRYSDLQDQLEVVQETGRVLGAVIASGFRGLDHEERQGQLWNQLEAALAVDELRMVGPIVTLTPAKATVDVGDDSEPLKPRTASPAA